MNNRCDFHFFCMYFISDEYSFHIFFVFLFSENKLILGWSQNRCFRIISTNVIQSIKSEKIFVQYKYLFVYFTSLNLESRLKLKKWSSFESILFFQYLQRCNLLLFQWLLSVNLLKRPWLYLKETPKSAKPWAENKDVVTTKPDWMTTFDEYMKSDELEFDFDIFLQNVWWRIWGFSQNLMVFAEIGRYPLRTKAADVENFYFEFFGRKQPMYPKDQSGRWTLRVKVADIP